MLQQMVEKERLAQEKRASTQELQIEAERRNAVIGSSRRSGAATRASS